MTNSKITMTRELALYREVRDALLMEELVDDLFISCGTLLGFVRGDGTIHLDDDFDSSYVSHYKDPKDLSQELVKIGITLNKYGFDAHVSVPMNSHLHVHRRNDYSTRIDVFMWYTDDKTQLRIPAGIATDQGEYLYTGSTWNEDVGLSVPDRAEELLLFHYGEDWKTPRVGSDWKWWREFQRVWKSARLSNEQVLEVAKSRPDQKRRRPRCEK